MKSLYDEVIKRFPEVEPCISEGNEDLPYVVMASIVDWLRELTPSQINLLMAAHTT